MGTTQKNKPPTRPTCGLFMGVLLITLCWSTPIHAGWAGEEAAAIIAALAPVLSNIFEKSSEIKDALKFNELIKQYDDMQKIEKKSQEDISQIKEDSKTQAKNSDDISVELKRYVKQSEDAYKIVTDADFREKYLLDFVIGTANPSSPYMQSILQKLKRNESLSLNDVDEIYGLISLNDEEREIRRLQDLGMDEATITDMMRQRHVLDKERENLKKKTELRKDTVLLKADLDTRKADLEAKYAAEADPKNKSLILSELDSVNQKIKDYEYKLLSMDADIETNVGKLKALQVKYFQTSNMKAMTQKNRADIAQYYGSIKGTSGTKMERFVAFVQTHFLGGGVR